MAKKNPTKLIGPPWSQQRWEVAPTARLLPALDEDGNPIGDSWWVPFGDGWEIPAGGEYSGTGPFNWAIWIHVIDGTAECVALTGWGHGNAPLTAASLRRLPIGRLVHEGVLVSSRPADEVPKRYVKWSTVEEAKRQRAQVEETHRRAKRNPRDQAPITDDLLQDVARIYRSELAGGSPTKAVAEQLNYSRASAGRLVMQARARGFLPPTEPRKARA